MSGTNSTMPQVKVASYRIEQVRSDRWPVVVVHYTDSRGYERTSQCRWNSIAAAHRHGKNLVGLVIR